MPVRPALSQLVEVVGRTALLVAAQLRLGDGAGQPVIALDSAGEDEQMGALGVGDAVLRRGESERELGTVDRPQALILGRRLGEADRAVEPVVVGDGQRRQAQPHRLLHQGARLTGAVEEAVRRVAVQLGVRDGIRRRLDRRVLVLLPLAVKDVPRILGLARQPRSSSRHETSGFDQPISHTP